MITKLKIFETFGDYEHDDSLIDILIDKIIDEAPEIDGYTCSKEFNDVIEWVGSDKNDYIIISTPYWGDDVIPLEVYNYYGEGIEGEINSINIKPLKSLKLEDIPDILKIYFKFIEKEIKRLNKRKEIINFLKKVKIIKNINAKIDGVIYHHIIARLDYINDIRYTEISTDDIFDIYYKIESEIPELISTTKYNL